MQSEICIKSLFEACLKTDEKIQEEKTVSFEIWIAKVNRLLVARLGLDTECIEDRDYYSMYEDEYTPKEVVDQIMEEIESGNW